MGIKGRLMSTMRPRRSRHPDRPFACFLVKVCMKIPSNHDKGGFALPIPKYEVCKWRAVSSISIVSGANLYPPWVHLPEPTVIAIYRMYSSVSCILSSAMSASAPPHMTVQLVPAPRLPSSLISALAVRSTHLPNYTQS